MGLFAQDTDGTEILYAVSYDSNPTYIASKDDGADITMKFCMYIVSTSDINITLTLPKTAEEIATVAAGYAAKAAESEAKAKKLEATANDYLQTTQQAMTLANGYANTSKAWANVAENDAKDVKKIMTDLQHDDFFEIDVSGGLMPTEYPTYSAQFEVDNHDDIQPKELI